MSVQPATDNETAATRRTLMWILGIITAIALLVVITFTWLDTRKTPTIVFLATPGLNIAVEVRGAVSTPGVVYLDPGARLVDVVDSSGGFTSEADRALMNMSTRVSDGQIVVIPTIAPESGSAGTLININSASADELKELPGIGDVLAQRIVDYREFNGPYLSADELDHVEGINLSLVDSLRPLITVSGDD